MSAGRRRRMSAGRRTQTQDWGLRLLRSRFGTSKAMVAAAQAMSDPWNYKTDVLLTRNRQGVFDCQKVGATQVVGKAVEVSLKLAYRPAAGVLPLPVSLQTKDHIPRVYLHDIRLPGSQRASNSVSVMCFPSDSEKAISICAAAVKKLAGPPWHLQVLAADHAGPAGTAHDMLMSPMSWYGLKSCLQDGLYSVEIKCREFTRPDLFDWQGVLTSEAVPLWEQERSLAAEAHHLKGRLLLLVQLEKPCPRGDFHLHCSMLKNRAHATWEPLFGWAGFQRSAPCARPAPPPSPAAGSAGPRALSAEQPPAARSRPVTSVRDPEKAWKEFLKKVGACDEGSWVNLTTFLRYVKDPAHRPKRYVDGDTKRTWLTGPRRNRAPQIKRDWDYIKTADGGGAGAGVLHGKVSFLNDVYMAYYKDRV